MHALNIVQQLIRSCCPCLHAARLTVLLAAVGAAVRARRLTLTELGRALIGSARPKHGIKRIDRLLGNLGYDPTYGARQLRRTIQKMIEDPLAETIIRGRIPEHARVEVDVEGGNFVFREAETVEAPLELAEH